MSGTRYSSKPSKITSSCGSTAGRCSTPGTRRSRSRAGSACGRRRTRSFSSTISRSKAADLHPSERGSGGEPVGKDGPAAPLRVQRPSLRELVAYFLRLGALGFGGPVALANHMRRDLAETRGWLTEAEYDRAHDTVAVAFAPARSEMTLVLTVPASSRRLPAVRLLSQPCSVRF